MSKHLRLIIPFLIFSGIFFILWRGLGLHPSIIPSPLIGRPAPTFELPQLTSAKTTSEKDFIGHITLLNVWATWCSICAEEHAFLMQLAQTEDIFIYGLNYKDDPTAAKNWLATEGNPYRIVAADTEGYVGIDFGVYGTPETFLIDKKGIIRAKYVGALTKENWASHVKPRIDQLRNEPE